MAKISKSYILTPPHLQGQVMSEKCEEPIGELIVQVWLLYHHPNFKYCTLFVSGTELQTNRQTNGQTDRQTDDPITRCPRRTFQAGGIKRGKGMYTLNQLVISTCTIKIFDFSNFGNLKLLSLYKGNFSLHKILNTTFLHLKWLSKTRGPKGHISCTWVQCATFWTNWPGRLPCFVNRHEKHKLGRRHWDLASCQVGWILFSGFIGEVKDVKVYAKRTDDGRKMRYDKSSLKPSAQVS